MLETPKLSVSDDKDDEEFTVNSTPKEATTFSCYAVNTPNINRENRVKAPSKSQRYRA